MIMTAAQNRQHVAVSLLSIGGKSVQATLRNLSSCRQREIESFERPGSTGLPRSASWIEEMEKRSRRRIRDLVTQLASQGLSQNEIECARISMMAKSTSALLTGRIQKRKTNLSIAHFQLATHGRSIQLGSGTRNGFKPKLWHKL